MDMIFGPMAGTGYLIIVTRVNGEWHEEERRVVWVN
jgi:hypothetical protein